MSEVIFTSYASGYYRKNIFWNKFFAKLFVRPKKILIYTDDDLKKTALYRRHCEIFDAPIGGGYWAWKPWVILQAMDKAANGDVVLYHDCGKGLKYKNIIKPRRLINYAITHGAMPGVLIPVHGKNKSWTHRQCFEQMECLGVEYQESPQVEASVSAWLVNDKNRRFVSQWLNYCLNLKIVADSPEPQSDTFICHRYDQSVLTNLVIKHNMKPIRLSFDDLHFSKCMSLVDLDIKGNSFFMRAILYVFNLKRKLKHD